MVQQLKLIFYYRGFMSSIFRLFVTGPVTGYNLIGMTK